MAFEREGFVSGYCTVSGHVMELWVENLAKTQKWMSSVCSSYCILLVPREMY